MTSSMLFAVFIESDNSCHTVSGSFNPFKKVLAASQSEEASASSIGKRAQESAHTHSSIFLQILLDNTGRTFLHFQLGRRNRRWFRFNRIDQLRVIHFLGDFPHGVAERWNIDSDSVSEIFVVIEGCLPHNCRRQYTAAQAPYIRVLFKTVSQVAFSLLEGLNLRSTALSGLSPVTSWYSSARQ